MDLRQLQTFVEVVERGSFSAAADALGVTQPAVSQQIQTLERMLGEPLIDRSGRRAAPTDRGEVLHRYALRMLALRDELARELAQDSDQPTGHLIVGASTGPGEHVLPQLLGGFRAAHPRVEVTLRVDATGSGVRDASADPGAGILEDLAGAPNRRSELAAVPVGARPLPALAEYECR